MNFSERKTRVSFCDDRDDKEGCGNMDPVLPEGHKNRHCSRCGQETIIVDHSKWTEKKCPNNHNHEFINENGKFCVECGAKLIVNEKYSITEIGD